MSYSRQLSKIKAKINTNDNKHKIYYGLTAITFKEKWRRHMDTFKNDPFRNKTDISEYVRYCKHH